MTQETKIEPRSKDLAYELMGVLADVDHAGIGAFDWVCYDTVKRVVEELLAGNVDTFTDPELGYMAEEAECVHKCLDDAGVPRGSEAGSSGYRLLNSLWGRVLLYGNRKAMPEEVNKKQIAAYTQVITSLEARLATLQGRSQQSLEAVKTLQSERDANAILTEEVARLTAERAMPESVPGLVKRLRSAVIDEYEGKLANMDDLVCEAADALEAAYGVTSKDKQC